MDAPSPTPTLTITVFVKHVMGHVMVAQEQAMVNALLVTMATIIPRISVSATAPPAQPLY